MAKLTEYEKDFLIDHEDLFATTDINKALDKLIEDFWLYDPDLPWKSIRFATIFEFLCQGTSLMNELDNTVSKKYGYLTIHDCGTDTIDNSKLTYIDFELVDPNLKVVSFPNATTANPRYRFVDYICKNLTDISIPNLTTYSDDFAVIDIFHLEYYNKDLRIYTNAALIKHILKVADLLVKEDKIPLSWRSRLENEILIEVKD